MTRQFLGFSVRLGFPPSADISLLLALVGSVQVFQIAPLGSQFEV